MLTAIEKLAQFILHAKEILIFTGAGISTESGISDYRSKGGLWDRFQPVTFQEFLVSQEKREQYWRQKMELYESLENAQPNAGHKAIAELEQLGKLKGIITQNIDGLQQLAGSDPNKILELHGSTRETICLSCGEIKPWQEVYERLKSGDGAPLCYRCKGILKPNTISFGQPLNPEVLAKAIEWAGDCDLLLALGSTLVVEPAASIPRMAKQQDAKLVIVTLSETPLDAFADIKIENGIGKILSEVLNLIKAKR